MNVLQILPELNVGGVETGTLDLAKYLIRQGHRAIVVSNGGEMVPTLESLGARHYKLPVHKKSIFSILKMVPKLAEIINKENIDIIHARSRAPAWIAYFAARKTNKTFITTCHGFYKKHPFSYVMGWGKRVICPSNVIARRMMDDFDVPHERLRLIPRSVDLEKFKYINPDNKRKKDEFNIGIIGRLTPLKGHLHFIKAMAKVYRDIRRLKIWIVGDASASKDAYKEQLRVLVRRLGLNHCTEFLGTQRDIPGIMSHLDLLVLATTTQEAFGRVIIEAQAAGVPVVATSVGGVVDIIDDNKTGLLVPPADPQTMSEAIMKIFRNRELARDLAENAYQKVKERYNVELMVKNTLDVYNDALHNSRMLIIKLSSLGDIILSTAAIRAIKEKFAPNYKISFLVSEECKDLLLRCPYIDELIVCDLKNKDKGLKGLLKLGRELRRRNFDIVIDLQNNRKSHILSRLTLALNRYGYDNRKLGFLLNHRIKDDKLPLSPVVHQFRILEMLGIGLKDSSLELWPSEEEKAYVEEFLKSQWVSDKERIVGINISASQRWITKIWPDEYLIKLCEDLFRRGIRIAMTGTEEDLARANMLVNSMKNAKPINACGKTNVNQLACLIKKCSVYISGDSAPLHIAAAVNTPLVALFGSTDPNRHMPPAKASVIIKKDLDCSPCYKSKCKSKKCMELIRPEEVLAAIEKLMTDSKDVKS